MLSTYIMRDKIALHFTDPLLPLPTWMAGGGYGREVSLDRPIPDMGNEQSDHLSRAAVVYPMSSGSLLQYTMNQESV